MDSTKALRFFAVLVCILACQPAARAAALPSGSSIPVSGAGDPFVGLTPDETTGSLPFQGTDALGNILFTGTLVQDVFLDTTTGGVSGVSFRWRLTLDEGSVGEIRRISMTSFQGWTLDADFVADDPGEAPSTATRSSTGSVVGFNYPVDRRISAGESTKTLFIQTDAPSYKTGSTQVINGGVATVRTFAPAGTCEGFLPPQLGVGDARAYGVRVDLLGSNLIPPTPDSNVASPQTLIQIPAGPLAEVDLLHVEESGSSDATGADAGAIAQTSQIRLLDQGGGNFLVTATSVKAQVTCEADGSTATCTSAGSILQDVVINGEVIGTVTEPETFILNDPIADTTTTIKLLEKIGTGANAGIPQPQPGLGGDHAAGLTVNAIHVTVTPGNVPLPDPIVDVIVAHAEAEVSYGPICEPLPHVSGHAFVVGVVADETALDVTHDLLNEELARVDLPSTGGNENATLAHLGPVGDGTNTLIESNTAFSHTSGAIDAVGNSANSTSHAQVEGLTLLDTGSDPTGPLLSADVVRAECSSTADSGGASSTADTTILAASLGGTDLCAALGLEPQCKPPPNTELLSIPGLKITLNEQIPDPATPNATGITVNAIHIEVLGPDAGFAVGVDIIVSQAHCDAGVPFVD